MKAQAVVLEALLLHAVLLLIWPVSGVDVFLTLPNQTVPTGSTVDMKANLTLRPELLPINRAWCSYGISDGSNINPSPHYLLVELRSGNQTVTAGDDYDSRASFIGDITVGKAWFRMANVTVNDTNTYKMRCFYIGPRLSDFFYPKMNVTVLPVATTQMHTTTLIPTTEAENKPQSATSDNTRSSEDKKVLDTIIVLLAVSVSLIAIAVLILLCILIYHLRH